MKTNKRKKVKAKNTERKIQGVGGNTSSDQSTSRISNEGKHSNSGEGR